jgi:hypothetical protein
MRTRRLSRGRHEAALDTPRAKEWGGERQARAAVGPRLRALIAAYFSVCALLVLVFAIVAALHAIVAALHAIVAALHAIVVATLPLAMLAGVVAWGWRWSRVEVIGNDTDLIVRNLIATRRIRRRSIRDFRIGGARGEYLGRAIRAVLDDGSTVVLLPSSVRQETDTDLAMRDRQDLWLWCGARAVGRIG